MKVAITGPQGSGKTTLLKQLQPRLAELGLDLVALPEVTRTVKDLGFPINESGADETQLMILATHIQNVLAKDNYIVDRCLLDGYIYTQYLQNKGEVSEYVTEFFYQLLKRYFSSYDIVFYVPNEFPLEDDGVRSVAEEFRREISRLFEVTLSNFTFAVTAKNVVTLRGSVEARLQIALAAIEAKRKAKDE